MSGIQIYNTLSRKKEDFVPLNPPHVGMYVCGPTVYSEAHIGHARVYVTFDVVYRFLQNELIGPGYTVRYVRNITDVGHLLDDADAGEDKIAKKARLEKIEPMEVVQRYTNSFQKAMRQLNTLPPSIEPTATGHLIDQIDMIKRILANGYAYEADGNVYFDVLKYNEKHPYGILSGRVLDDLVASDRRLDGQDLKKNKQDFAIWKKAEPEHIMRWDSPWGLGFPGWHLECSVMSTKYLGKQFDLHGGGMDLIFPHHECEIAQSQAGDGTAPVRYWMHNNMMTLNGQKISRSLGNAITLEQYFVGDHPLLEQAYTPMTIRFFILQSHYRSTVDFSNTALQAAEKGLARLGKALDILESLDGDYTPQPDAAESNEVSGFLDQAVAHLKDDFNTAQTIARLFDLSHKINAYKEGKVALSKLDKSVFQRLRAEFPTLFRDVLGLESNKASSDGVVDGLMELVLAIRESSRSKKDYDTSDKIRDALSELQIRINDGTGGSSWSFE